MHALVDYLLPPANTGIQDVVERSGSRVEMADAYRAFGDDQDIYVIQGDTHPTARGHEVLAEIGLDALTSQTN